MANENVPAGFSTGLIPRNYGLHPVGAAVFAPEFPASALIDESEWPDRLNEKRKNRTGLLELREDFYEILKSLDQDGFSLCWAFSTTKAVMYLRKMMNLPDIRLSAWYVAGMIKKWRDEGGNGFESLDFLVKFGAPAMDKCPKYSRSAVTQDAAENALQHVVLEWWDGSDDPRMAQKQLISSLFVNLPGVTDLNDMGHSMVAIDIGNLKPVEIIYDNSWGDNGSERGLYRGRGRRALPDGLVIPRVSMPSMN